MPETQLIMLQINDIRFEHVNKPVTLKCIVEKTGDIGARLIEGAFECARCKSMTFIIQDDPLNRFIEPLYCQCNEDKKGVFRLIHKESKFEDYQEIIVHDTDKRYKLKVLLTNGLVGKFSPGDIAIITGILRSVPPTRKSTIGYQLEATSIQ